MMRARGFTLLELLVALSIFALVAALAYQALDTVLNAEAHTRERAERLGAVQRAFARLERDLTQAVPRPVRDALGGEEPALRGGGAGVEVFSLTRTGWRNPLERPRSHLQRVAYVYQGGALSRRSWPALDRGPGAEPYEETLLENVDAVDIRFLDAARQWQRFWPPAGAEEDKTALPLAVELSLDLSDWGRLTRLFQVAG
ncbi:MAG TPA: type II secretion system protein GspJ [Gammaproteobacteria bacterium]|nr:type II secretion system protein GspJ [Gammaproteobacteria bacterium]